MHVFLLLHLEPISVSFLNVRSPRSRCWHSWFLLKAVKDSMVLDSSLTSGSLLAIFGIPLPFLGDALEASSELCLHLCMVSSWCSCFFV